jgi:Uma2 family endonuclease
MATATMTPKSSPLAATVPAQVLLGDQCVEMHGIGWAGYETVLRIRGDGSQPKMIYVDGDLYLVSPALPQVRLSRRIGFFMDQLILGLRLPSVQSGQTTFRRRGKRGGVEGDHTYYLASEPRVRGKMQIDLRTDPPPDLAIEVVNTHKAEAALKVYRRLGVPEVWVFEEGRLRILIRQENGQYAEGSSSLAFPFLTSAEATSWMQRPYNGPGIDWMEEVHRWVFDVLVPRAQATDHQNPPKIRQTDSALMSQEGAIELARALVEKKHRCQALVRSIREEEKRWVVSMRFDPPPPGRHQGDIILVYKKTRITRSIGQR